jgi:hypothetical protein
MNRNILQLQELHPLFRRLSGQVVWLLFEERGVPEAEIQAFSDLYEAEKRRSLELLAAALDRGDYTHLLLEKARQEEICRYCASAADSVIPLDDPELPSMFPPYGLGCAIRPRLLTLREFSALERPLPAPRTGPPDKLLCGEWLFDVSWTGRSDLASAEKSR